MIALAIALSLSGALAYADDGSNSPEASSSTEAALQVSTLSDATPRAKRTIMFYVCGSNLEEDSGMASGNLLQVLDTDFGNGEDVRFVVMTGGSRQWHMPQDKLVFPDGVDVPDDAVEIIDPDTGEAIGLEDKHSSISGPYNQIWEAKSQGASENAGKLVLLDGNGLKDARADTEGDEEWMSDPMTLKSFINYCVEYAPAEKYDLILWDHGGGATGGFALDFRRPQKVSSSNTMTFAQIIDALKNNAVTNQGDGDPSNDGTFDFVNFDACLMGSTEVTLGIADYTDYYIASPKEIPGYGEVYTGWLGKLGENPETSTYELGRTLVDDFIEFYDAGYDDGTRQEATMAVIDIKALLQTGFVDALSTISEVLKRQVEEGLFYDELRSVKQSIKYDDTQFYDLGNLVSHLGVSLWELEADDVTDSTTIDMTNEYTDAAKAVLSALSNPDIVYAGNTMGVFKESQFHMGSTGETIVDLLGSSGMHLFFPREGYVLKVKEYDEEAIAPAIEAMPNDGRARFLASYVDALYEYNFVLQTGRAVTKLVNSGVPRNTIDYERVKEHWLEPSIPGFPELVDYNDWNSYISPLLAMVGDGDAEAGEAKVKPWLDEVVKQQAAEAISVGNVSAKSVVMKNGEGRRVQIDETRRRVVSGVDMHVEAELPAVYEYIMEHEEDLGYLIGESSANLSLGSVSAMIDGSSEMEDDGTGNFLREYIIWLNSSTTTSWNLNPMQNEWYAIEDAQGNRHVAAAEADYGKIIVPMIRLRGDTVDLDPELLLLGFDGGDLSSIFLTDDDGNRTIIRACDLKTELKLIPAIYIGGWVMTVLPISKSAFTVTPDTVDDIKLVTTEIKNIDDIGDVDDDGEAFGFKYVATDIYGSEIDITDKVKDPEEKLVDIKLAEVESVEYTGEELAPSLVYDGKALVEGVDFVWTRNAGDDPIVLPGDYDITILGLGDFTGLKLATFTVNAIAEDIIAAIEAEIVIRSELAKVDKAALDAGDAEALAAASAALAAYGELTEAQKTQVDSALVMALLDVSQRAAAAKEAAASAAANRIDLSGATVSMAKVSYTGKPLEPEVTVVLGGKSLKEKTDYTVAYANNKNAGTGVVVVKGVGSYAGAAVKVFDIAKANNTLTVKAKTAKVKLAKTKKGNVKLAVKKAMLASKAFGKITYKKSKGNKKIAIAENGRVTVKKGIKKGTYKVKVKVTAAGDANHNKQTKAVTFKVKVA